ncbi:MAG: Uma2 family endonuclease [Actinomycetota bacterium]|nr:Uma2 family endonuclease [Actinomycetota bacterium]
MATQPRTTGLTYEDLRGFPEDNLRRELIDGELIVTAAPSTRHQDAVLQLGARLLAYANDWGGKVYVAPTDVFLTETNVVEPDVLFVRPENVSKVERPFVRGAPDLVMEVSSPSTRRLELVRKRELYERFAVPEYWYVDLDADRVEVYRLEGAQYEPPVLLTRVETLESPQVPGFSIPVGDLLGPPEE